MSEGTWAQALDIARRVRLGERFEGRSHDWVRHRIRISRLPEEMGAELDRLGASFRVVRDVAYGWSKREQRRRFDQVVAKLSADRPCGRRLRRHEADIVEVVTAEVMRRLANGQGS